MRRRIVLLMGLPAAALIAAAVVPGRGKARLCRPAIAQRSKIIPVPPQAPEVDDVVSSDVSEKSDKAPKDMDIWVEGEDWGSATLNVICRMETIRPELAFQATLVKIEWLEYSVEMEWGLGLPLDDLRPRLPFHPARDSKRCYQEPLRIEEVELVDVMTRHLPAGRYRLSLLNSRLESDFILEGRVIELADGEECTEVLEATPRRVMTGTVLDENGTPPSNVRLRLHVVGPDNAEQGPFLSVYVDENGRFSIPAETGNLPLSGIDIVADDCETLQIDAAEISDGEVIDLGARLLRKGGFVSGAVTDINGIPLPRVVVETPYASVRTELDGTFSLPNVPAGGVDAICQSSMCAETTISLTLVRIPGGEPDQSVDIRLNVQASEEEIRLHEIMTASVPCFSTGNPPKEDPVFIKEPEESEDQ